MSPPRHLAEEIPAVVGPQHGSKTEAIAIQSTREGAGPWNAGLVQTLELETMIEEPGPPEYAHDRDHYSSDLLSDQVTAMAESNDDMKPRAAAPEANVEAHVTSADDLMESSTATLKPEAKMIHNEKLLPDIPAMQPLYLDPTPKTPGSSLPVSRSTSSATSTNHHGRFDVGEPSPTRSDAGFDERHSASEDEREKDSRSEIQSIMDQFSEEGGGPGEEEVMSPRFGVAGPLLGSPIHPPRKSSLEPLNRASTIQSFEDLRLAPNSPQSFRPRSFAESPPAVPPKPGSIHSFSPARASDERFPGHDTPLSPTGSTLHQPPPPEAEPDLPFDFHRFLEQLRHKTADPVAKFLRSFLAEFGKKQWMVHEQVKIIGDFLAFITNKMANCDVWRDVSDAEFDNAREGMEKLVMNRLYTQTFSPAIPPPQPLPGSRSRRKHGERLLGLGRKGQSTLR